MKRVKKTDKTLKIRLSIMIITLILLMFQNTSLGYTDEENEYISQAESIVNFYNNTENWIIDDDYNLTGYTGKTNEDIKNDIEILTIVDNILPAVQHQGTSSLKYKVKTRLNILQEFLNTQEQQQNNEQEKEENEKDIDKQKELNNYSIEQMVEYYRDHNDSLASLPETGNVRDVWIATLKNTSEYQLYISSTTQRDNGLPAYRTGETYYQMLSSIDPSINDPIARNNPTDDDNESTALLGQSTASANHTPDEIINEADNFLKQANSTVATINGDNLKSASSTLYNILLSIGIFLAVAIGMYLGVKFMMSSVEEKVKVKEALIPYIVGCIVIFTAFIIWKMVILLLNGIA